MNDPSIIQIGHTKKYQIPLNHLEHKYIDQCNDGIELERIYKELIGGEEGIHPLLAQLTLDRLRNVLPDSQLLQQNTIQIDKSTVNIHVIPSISVINNQHNGIVSKSNDEWKKFEQTVSHEFSSDDDDNDELSTENQSYEVNKRLHMAKQHSLNADTAFQSNNYQQSIDLYTKSISLEPGLLVYINRAIAYFKLNNFDASIKDCSHVLSIYSKNAKALTCRAQCYLAKQQYDQAKHDLDCLLTLEPDDSEIQDLMNTLIALQKQDIQSTTISNITTDDQTYNSMNIDNNHPRENIHQFEISPSNDDDDMALGDEAGVGDLEENLSGDDDRHVSRSINVSPTIDDDLNTQQLTTQKSIDQSIAVQIGDDNNTISSHHQTNDDETDYPESSYKHNSFKTHDDSYSQNSSIYDDISNSNFGLIVQNWLRDLVTLQSNRRYYDRPWSKSSRPWSIDKIQHDIDRFNRFNDYRNTIEVSKKMLQNGILDYHYYAEYLVETLRICSKSYLKLQDYLHCIQYATEALQYNRNDDDTLIYRAKGFENDKCLLFSYADYTRVPVNNFNYHIIQNTCAKLINELNSTEDKNWRENLPNNQNDIERYLIYLKLKTNYSEINSYEWYLNHANQFYLDGCFVLAIRFYTICIEFQPEIKDVYLKRAACYLKVFEPQKVISDCEIVLKEDEHNFLAVYYTASAYKISRDYRAYELTLKDCIKLQPNNQIILAEYYTYRHEQIPRKKRRIRIKSIDENHLTYEELEQIRLDKINLNASLESNDIREQCSFILHLQSFDSLTPKLLEMIVNISRMMIQIEENHQSNVLPFSYIKFCFEILIKLTTLPEIDSILSMMEDNYRVLLDELISYYSKRFNNDDDDVEKLNRLKRL